MKKRSVEQGIESLDCVKYINTGTVAIERISVYTDWGFSLAWVLYRGVNTRKGGGKFEIRCSQ